MEESFDWRDALEQLFAATVNQDTLENAADLMVSVSAADKDYHEQCLFLLSKGKSLAEMGDRSIIGYVNKSGYRVQSVGDAYDLMVDFEKAYLKAYRAATA